MATIRAYRLAEELGIDRNEIVEKAEAVGIELKSAMAALDADQADELRAKLGDRKRKNVSETRVVSGKGGAVLRRRKRVAPPPEVVPEPAPSVAEVTGEAVPEPVAPVSGPVPAEDLATPDPTPSAPPPSVAPSPSVAPAPAPGQADSRGPAPGGAPEDARNRGRQRKRVREVVNLKEQEQFARQVTGRGPMRRRPVVADPRGMQSPRRKRRDAPAPKAVPKSAAEIKKVVRVPGNISIGELARQLGSRAAQVQARLMATGKMVSINQTVDVETARLLAAEMGFDVQDTGFNEAEFIEVAAEATAEAGALEPRSPIVTVMGHVDHGKTSLLDAIRKTSVVDGEAGGITQHIGAYRARAGNAILTFIDTPGHAAFTAMRARGAQVTDIVILVVAASDGPMPQTIEAIQHAKAAGCPIVVAINKCDLPGADPQMTRQKLMEHELVAEEFGGDTICVEVSAVKGTGLGQLLEMIALQAELLELKADPTRRAKGVVLEAQLDKGRGPVATVLIQDGTLRRGDIVVVGNEWGRVRQLENENGDRLSDAGPSIPVQILGLSGVPDSGMLLNAVENERGAKQVIDHRQMQARGETSTAKPVMSLEEFFARGGDDEAKELAIVLRSDVHGTCEAVKEALENLSTDSVTLKVLSAGVGAPGESDVNLAKASGAIIVGFNVRPEPAARRAAEQQGVDIRIYQIIYELLDEVRAAMAGLLPPTIREVVLGRAEVRQPFTIPKTGTIAGSMVTEGLIRRNAKARLVRDGVQIYEGRVGSLRRFKDDAREVQKDFECGIGIEGYNDIKIGDVIEAFELEEHAAEL